MGSSGTSGKRTKGQNGKKSGKASKKARKAGTPKKKCCVSRPRCRRCPIAMLEAGTLPAGWTVRKRRLVRVEDAA